MTTNELWQYLSSKQLYSCKPFDREFIWILESDFTEVKHHFATETNLLHSGQSLRSPHPWKHIHILKHGLVIHAHIDTGNVTRSYLLYSLPHCIFDIMPYIYFAVRHRSKISSLFYIDTHKKPTRVTNRPASS